MRYYVDILDDTLRRKQFVPKEFNTLTEAENYAIDAMNSMKWKWCRCESQSVMYETHFSVFEYSRYYVKPMPTKVYVRIIRRENEEAHA